MRTSNKKYFKRFDIPDLKRLKINLDESDLGWKFQNNTLIIGYDKPEKILELERKKRAEIQQLSKKQGAVSTQAPAISGQSSGKQSEGDVNCKQQ